MPIDFVSSPFIPDPNSPLSKTTLEQKQTVYIFANGLRNLRQLTGDAAIYFHELTGNIKANIIFLIILMVSVMMTFASVVMMFYQIWQIEHIQSDILSLYAYLSKDHLKDTYSKALLFMKEIAEGSFIKQISPKLQIE